MRLSDALKVARLTALKNVSNPSPSIKDICRPPLVEATNASNDVTVVRDAKSAALAIKRLCSLHSRHVVAWDTETTGINPKKQSPVGNGSVICLTAYAGDNVDFGHGPRLFVDCLGSYGEQVLGHFKQYFQDDRFWKCWHNYSFDRHILANHGIDARGFRGDTMHMARLLDTSRKRYSLEELVKDHLGDLNLEKYNMVSRFGRRRVLKSGAKSKDLVVPDTVTLHSDESYRNGWIDYATMDAKLTYKLFEHLNHQLSMSMIQGSESDVRTLLEVYYSWIVPFGEMLTDMERYGFKVDVEQLKRAQLAAEKDRFSLEDSFRDWAESKCPGARYMNVHSDRQKQQLLFAPCKQKRTKLTMEAEKTFQVEQFGIQAERLLAEKRACGEMQAENGGDKKVKRLKTDVTLRGLGKKAPEFTTSGWPSVSAASLKKLAGNPRASPPVYGDPSDEEMCRALADVVEASSIMSLENTFIVPLQSWPGSDGRIHASLNLNTETGRLSSRRPNLQNQPALEKDRYKIRKSFVCEPGNRLIVADYGQLELRLMAHMTQCASMIEAFRAGGDFHSRTALAMFDHVAEAVNKGQCLLERSKGSEEEQDVPLVKEMFASERRKAKTLNFSIAYGKTVVGLAKDWNVSVKEARKTLELWYRERSEVRVWQERCRESARKLGYVETMLGRRRHLPDARSENKFVRGHAERAAINAPLQGSAADLVMAAMLKLHCNRELNALGWRVILQVHDEVVLEGPADSADIALNSAVETMKNPVHFPLLVDLVVDAKVVSNWFDAK